jgi:hypothetical protein
VIVDALGNPLAISLTGGRVHNITQVEALAAGSCREPESARHDTGAQRVKILKNHKAKA